MSGNINFFHVEELKKQGINFKLTYTVEFTQYEKVLQEIEKDGNFDNVTKKEFDNIEESVNFLIKLTDPKMNIPVVYYQLWVDLKINDMIVMEDTICSLVYVDSSCEVIHRLRDDNQCLINELTLHNDFLSQFSEGVKQFEKYKKELEK